MNNELHYRVLQLDPESRSTRDLIFRGWNAVKEKIDMNLYRLAYEGTLPADKEREALDAIFLLLNSSHPKGYKGRSLSVSDVIEFPETGNMYYCDNIGWTQIPQENN